MLNFRIIRWLCPVLLCIWPLSLGDASAQSGDGECNQPFGTTIITHGRNKSSKSDWVQEMANAIIDRSIIEGGPGGTILRYDPVTGWAKFVQGSLVPDGEVVLIFNWVDDSGIFLAGISGSGEAAGDALFAALADAHVVESDGTTPLDGWDQFSFVSPDRGLHFIGHSRGAVVNSEAVQRLGDVLNRQVNQVTTLDPFPETILADDPFPVTWSNVDWADNYFQDILLPLFNPRGFPIDGAWDFELTGIFGGIFGGNGCEEFPHNDVPLWLLGTIDLTFVPCPPDVTRRDWYPLNEQHGYWFSNLVCTNVDEREMPSGPKTDLLPSAPLVNGDFELGPWAGWRYHGGFLDEDISTGEPSPVFFDSIKNSFVLQVGGPFDGLARHNRFFLADTFNTLELSYRVVDEDENQTDQLKIGLIDFVSAQQFQLGCISLDQTTAWLTQQFLIPENVEKNRTWLLQFSGASSRAQIALDDITLQLVNVPLLGDVNLDGVVDFLDIDPFVALLDAGEYQVEADINQDGVVDFLDIEPFVELLNSG